MKVVAIIPARGHSTGIPRKNARLLKGRPLLSYVVSAAREAPSIDEVFVSTDEIELAEIARQNGARVLERPAELAVPHATLDEVVVDAYRTLRRNGIDPDIIVTIQATCPLTSPRTVEKVVRECKSHDTVLTVVRDAHLAWAPDEHGTILPLYSERVNRQQLPDHYRETGSVLACRSSILDTGSRIGRRIGVVEVGKNEAIDIDDQYDWCMAEMAMSRRRVCFKVAGETTSSPAHAYRSLSIADRLIDHEVFFATSRNASISRRILERSHHPILDLAEESKAREIVAAAPDLVVNDTLNTDRAYMSGLMDHGIKAINFEDEGPGAALATRVVNSLYDVPVDVDKDKACVGVNFCCLRDEFYWAPEAPLRNTPENVLLFIGGPDHERLNLRYARWLDELPGDWDITVLLGINSTVSELMHELSRQLRHTTRIVSDSALVSKYIGQSDIAITTAGRTVFELASLGVPMVAVGSGKTNRFAESAPGVIYKNNPEDLSRDEFSSTIEQLLSSKLLRATMRDTLLASGVLEGMDNVLALIRRELEPQGEPQGEDQ
jgi:CMP-N-acetylneuraminic acid synthetase/spore coat polysaccharide biosynthesis predicted glycosyltransferase SpsG